jgi:hypothetical protein
LHISTSSFTLPAEGDYQSTVGITETSCSCPHLLS